MSGGIKPRGPGADAWSIVEVGRPQHSPTGALYPYFEQLTNDDRVGYQSLAVTMAGYELTRRVDTTPSLEVAVVDELPYALRYRAGDSVFIKTRSLRTNIEQSMRIHKMTVNAGSPLRVIVLGRGSWDPSQERMHSEALMQQRLFEQSGTVPTTYVYPTPGALNANAASADFTFSLDKFTAGTALVYAALHWFADANVMQLQPIINGQGLYVSGIAGVSATDSGLIPATQYFQSTGIYKLHWLNNDVVARTLTSGFLVLRVKG